MLNINISSSFSASIGDYDIYNVIYTFPSSSSPDEIVFPERTVKMPLTNLDLYFPPLSDKEDNNQ